MHEERSSDDPDLWAPEPVPDKNAEDPEMAGEKHLYLVVGGGYTSSYSALAPEIWQFGVRLMFHTEADVPPIGTLENEWDVVPTTIDRTETAWTITSNWTIEGGVPDLDVGDYLNDQAGPAAEAFIEAAGVFGAGVQLRTLRLYPIQAPDGKVIPAPPYAQGSPALLTWTGTQPTGASTGILPPQVSSVVSLRTQQVGRRGRGRIYPPPIGAGNLASGGEGGIVPSATRTSLANAAAAFMEALTYIDTDPAPLAVVPIVIGSPYVNFARITNCRVGSVFDGQTRRRRALVETYTTVAVDQTP